jgi:predicted P-loop ATPase
MAQIFRFPDVEWADRLHRTNRDTLRSKSIGNAMLLIENMPEMQGVFRFNALTREIEVTNLWPWDGADGRPLIDSDITNIMRWLESVGQFGITPAMALGAMQAVAERTSYNPLQDWLNGLHWDGIARIDRWMADYLGCEDSDYMRAISGKFLIGAVARAMQPGCRLDTMLILEGPQGALKSSALEALFGKRYFTDELADFGSKDAALQMQGVWAIEVAELSTFTRAAVERTKEFLSRRVDRMRPPYGRALVSWPRTAILIGTTNETCDYFRDDTGNRRFWPLRCTTIDRDGIANDRDKLLAEAVVRYQSGDTWWLDKDEAVLATEQQDERFDDDPWLEPIARHLSTILTDSVTGLEVLTLGLSVPLANITPSMKTRVGRCLRKLRWRLTFPKDETGTTHRVWKRP